MVNAGLTIDSGRQPGIFLFSCAAAFVLVAALAQRAAVRVLAVVLALGTTLIGLDCLTFSATAERDVLRLRRLIGARTLPWTQIAKVEPEPAAAVFVELGGRRLRLDLAGLRPEQRAGFDRTVARRIWESGRYLTPP
jgi:hypothetical protein